MSIKACVLSPAMHSILSSIHLHICVEQTLMLVRSTLALCEQVTEGRTQWCGIRGVHGCSRQGRKCSDRSRPRERGNRQLSVWRISKKSSRKGDAWTAIKGAMRITQINKKMRNLKQALSDFNFQWYENVGQLTSPRPSPWEFMYIDKYLSPHIDYINIDILTLI